MRQMNIIIGFSVVLEQLSLLRVRPWASQVQRAHAKYRTSPCNPIQTFKTRYLSLFGIISHYPRCVNLIIQYVILRLNGIDLTVLLLPQLGRNRQPRKYKVIRVGAVLWGSGLVQVADVHRQALYLKAKKSTGAKPVASHEAHTRLSPVVRLATLRLQTELVKRCLTIRSSRTRFAASAHVLACSTPPRRSRVGLTQVLGRSHSGLQRGGFRYGEFGFQPVTRLPVIQWVDAATFSLYRYPRRSNRRHSSFRSRQPPQQCVPSQSPFFDS